MRYVRGDATKTVESWAYLEEGDLMLKLWIRGVGSVGHQREMVELVPTTQVLGCLRDDFAPLHRLTIPKGRPILGRVS